MIPNKTCPRCGGEGPFGSNKSRKDGQDHLCKACRNASSRGWYGANSEHVRAENLSQYRENPEPHRLRSRQWNRTHREARRIIDQRHRALKASTESTLTVSEWFETLSTFGHACAYCLRTDLPLTQDHVIAVSRGGGHTTENIVPSCRPCNSRKKDKPVWVMAGQNSFSSYHSRKPARGARRCFA